MNYQMIVYILGFILRFEAGFLCLPVIVGAVYGEGDTFVYIAVAAVCFLVGFLMSHRKLTNKNLYAREGFVSVALGWIVLSAVGAVPFVVTGDIPSYVDALFETISGFTTTGASILTNVEGLSRANLFWRSFTHWIGGMGVFVFVMAIMPLLGSPNMNLMKAESPGPSVDRLVPKVKDTAKILYAIYIGITIVEAVLLVIFGLRVDDSLMLTFGTVGTGGFGVKNDGLASYSPAIQYTITIFMILSGINYSAYFLILRRKLKQAFKLEEVRVYLLIIAAATIAIFINTRHLFASAEENFRHVFFHVGSLMTSTGFSISNYDVWPEFSRTMFVLIMFVGACAGSTGGGIKVSRVIIAFKSLGKELKMLIHPRSVRKVTLDGKAVTHEVVRSTKSFILLYFVLMGVSILLISVDGFSFTTNSSAVISMLGNMGPGLEVVGPAGNYAAYSIFSKFVLMFDMLAGRLELFPILLLFYYRSWKRN